MSKRYLAGILAAVLVCTAFVGCGKPKTQPQPGTDEFTDAPTTLASGDAATDANGETSAAAQDGETAAATDAATDAPVVMTDTDGQPMTNADGSVQTVPAGGEDDQEGDYNEPPAATGEANVQSGASTGGAQNAALHITVETAEVTLDDLAAKDYTIPLTISIDKNPGINYSEWGLKLDERCTYTAEKKGADYSTVSFINDEKHFLWTAWTSGAQIESDAGSLLILNVTVPKDAQPGTTYAVEYADWSLANAAHIWQGGDNDWAGTDQVGWTNGGVVIK